MVKMIIGILVFFRAKRFYTKMAYTTKYDWRIRDLLDEAEDYIANDAKVAIDKLTAILEKYPDSPRGKYDLARALQFKFDETDPISESFTRPTFRPSRSATPGT